MLTNMIPSQLQMKQMQDKVFWPWFTVGYTVLT